MKIGLYGGIANASYVTARALRNQGADIVFIRDHMDMFPFSQPVWEDSEFTLPYEKISGNWSYSEWLEKEKELGWKRPDWIIDPPVMQSIFKRDALNFKRALKHVLEKFYISRYPHRAGVISLMRQCDILYVCGIEAEILAWASDVPYVIWPHGGDIRMAAGLSPVKFSSLKDWISQLLYRFFLRLSFSQCAWIGTHDAKGIGGNIGKIPYEFEYFPLPLLDRPAPLPRSERVKNLDMLMDSLGLDLPSASCYVFVPSRLDFYWKGTDRLIKAIERLGQQDYFHFIFAGWGNDYHLARQMISDKRASFLPCSLSKPLLFKFYQAVDIVVDQFLFGSYGAAAIEAISCGTPVMMSIDDKAFLSRDWAPPPVINVSTEDEIFQALTAIMNGNIDLQRASSDGRLWFYRTHSEAVAVKYFLNNLPSKAAK